MILIVTTLDREMKDARTQIRMRQKLNDVRLREFEYLLIFLFT